MPLTFYHLELDAVYRILRNGVLPARCVQVRLGKLACGAREALRRSPAMNPRIAG